MKRFLTIKLFLLFPDILRRGNKKNPPQQQQNHTQKKKDSRKLSMNCQKEVHSLLFLPLAVLQ